jgi:hypothetical protein
LKNHPVRAELFHADGQTDRQTDVTKLIVAFRNFAYAPENKHETTRGPRVNKSVKASSFKDGMPKEG